MRKLEDLPLVLTIEEAAEVLRISRWAAYEQARIWRESGGRQGLPVLTLGRCLRVSRATLRPTDERVQLSQANARLRSAAASE